MAVLPIRFFGDPVLREESRAVDHINRQLKTFTRDMAQTMYDYHGIGLAAPQVGVLRQVIVVDMSDHNYVVYVNPRIKETSRGKEVDEEGCLCLPEIRVPVARATRVVVEAQDLQGRLVTVEADDLLARILQHEIDHLQGKTIIDRTSQEKRRQALRIIRQSK